MVWRQTTPSTAYRIVVCGQQNDTTRRVFLDVHWVNNTIHTLVIFHTAGAFTHGAMGRWIDSSLSYGAMGRWIDSSLNYGAMGRWIDSSLSYGAMGRWIDSSLSYGAMGRWIDSSLSYGAMGRWIDSSLSYGAMGRWIDSSLSYGAMGRWIDSSLSYGAMGRWIDSSLSYFIPVGVPRPVQQKLWYVLCCLWDGAYKRTLVANQKEEPMCQQQVSSLTIRVVLYHMSDAI